MVIESGVRIRYIISRGLIPIAWQSIPITNVYDTAFYAAKFQITRLITFEWQFGQKWSYGSG